MAHKHEHSNGDSHVDGDSGDEGVIKHGMHIVSDFLHGRKHVHHHSAEEEKAHSHSHSHSHESPSRPASKASFEKHPEAEPVRHMQPREDPPVHVVHPHPHPIPQPTSTVAPAPAKEAVPPPPAAMGKAVPPAEPVTEPAPVVPPAPVAAVVQTPAEPSPLPGPVLEANYYLFCWGTPDSVTKSTSYTVHPLPPNLLRGDCTFSVSARTEQDGPRAVMSVESVGWGDSLLWVGTEHTNLVHAQWLGGWAKGREAEAEDGKEGEREREGVAWHKGWTQLVLIWRFAQQELTLYRDGTEVFTCPLSGQVLQLAESTGQLSLVLGRAKEGGKRALGWDGEIAGGRVWARALGAEEVRGLAGPEEVHEGYGSAWNDGFA